MRTSIALTGRNSPTHTMSVASALGVTGSNSASADAIAHDAHHRPRPTDQIAEHVGDIAAFEQKQIGAPVQQPFERAIEAASQRAGTIDQRTAVRRIGADRVSRRAQRQARERGALGAVAVEHVGRSELDPLRDVAQRRVIVRTEFARDRHAFQAERETAARASARMASA